MTKPYFSVKTGAARAHAALALLSVLAGMSFFGGAWTGLLLLIWAVWAIWPGLRNGFPVVTGTLPIAATIWLSWLVALVWISDTPYLSWFYFWTLAGLPVALLTWHFVRAPDEAWRWIRRGLWAGAGAVSAQGVWQVLSAEAVRAHGPLIDPNAYAGMLNLLFFPLAAWFFAQDLSQTRRWAAGLRIVVLFAMALAFFSANSRGGIIAWLMSMAILLVAMRGRPQYPFKVVLLLGMWGTAFLVMYALTTFNLVEAATKDESVSARWQIWQSTWLMIQSNTWLGSGLGTWSLHYPPFRDQREWGTTGYYAHNDYLQFLAEGGPVTLLIFLAILALSALQLWRLVRAADTRVANTEAIGLLIGVLAVAAHAFVNFIFYHAFISILCGLFIGRALQVADSSGVAKVKALPVATPLGRRLILGALAAIASAQLLLHEGARLLNCNHPVVSAIQRVYPSFSEYEAARFLHAVRPHEPIPRNLVLQFMAQGVGEAGVFGPAMQRAVLTEALDAYEIARKSAANRTQLGAEEAMLLIKYRGLLPDGEALRRAERLAYETLKLDPRHAESILALAEVQFARGGKSSGLQILSQAVPHLFSVRDRRLLEVVYVKHLLAPARYPQLDEIEQSLRKTPSVPVGMAKTNTTDLYEKAETLMIEVLRRSGRLQ